MSPPIDYLWSTDPQLIRVDPNINETSRSTLSMIYTRMARTEPCSKRMKLEPNGDSEDSEPLISRSVENQLPSLADYGEQEEYRNPFDSLPNEILQEICMLLSLRDKMSLRLVNQRLYSVCSDPYLWRNIFIGDAYHKTNAPFIKSAIQTCRPHVESLSLKGELPFSKYQRMIFTCKSIHTLNLYGFEISLDALENVHSALPHLQCLTLTYIDRCQLYSSPCNEYFIHFAKFKKLVLVYNFSEPVTLFERWLLNNCLPQIFIVISTNDKEYWSTNRQPLPNITHSAYFAAYKKYRQPLDFDFYDLPEYSFEIGPNSSESVAVTANGELIITMRDLITPTNGVSQRCAVFKHEAVTAGLSVYTSKYGVNITILGFSSVTVSLESFHMIVKETPNILEVSFKGSIISDSLDAYTDILSVHCLKLRGLDVSRFSTNSRDRVNFDVEHFWNLLSRMKYLEYLSVNCCSLSPFISNSQHDGRPSRVLTDRELAVKESVMNHTKRMTRLKSLQVIHSADTTTSKKLDYFISQHLLSIISNLESLSYLGIYISFAISTCRCIASLKLHNIEGLEIILQKCQKLSVLYINCAPIKVFELPVDPALYGSLTHLFLNCSLTPMSLTCVDALAINSKKLLKYLLLTHQCVSTNKDAMNIIKQGVIALYEISADLRLVRHDRNKNSVKRYYELPELELHMSEFANLD